MQSLSMYIHLKASKQDGLQYTKIVSSTCFDKPKEYKTL